MNLYPATAFIRHLLTARSAAGHGVHSPFVFDFLTTVVRGKGDTLIIREVESLRREMLADRRIVRVTDLGAGSAVHMGEERRISEIASTAALPQRQVALLARVAQSSGLRAHKEQSDVVPRKREGEGPRAQGLEQASDNSIILELGTSLGISTLALALAAPERRVVSVEGCPALSEIARENLRRHGAANAEILNMEFSEALSLLRKEGTRLSLAFIDGNHRGKALKQYVNEISTMGDEMIIVADDIHLNRDMYNTWRFLVDTALQVAASRKVPSGAEIMPPAHPGIAPATAEKMPPAHPGKAPATAEIMPPAHPGIAPATAEKMPPAHPGTAPATAEKMPLAHPGKAAATIETLRFGLIFFRRSLTPCHYRVRY